MVRFLRTVLLLFVLAVAFAPVALAQGSDTIFDEAGVLNNADKKQVQEAFDRVQEKTGHPLYAFLVPDTNVATESTRRELLARKAHQANVPAGAGVMVVAPNDHWSEVNVDKLSVDSQAVYEAMRPDLQRGDVAVGLIAGAQEVENESAGTRNNTDPDNPGSSVAGLVLGGILLALAVLASAIFFVRGRRGRSRELAQSRTSAEEEFAGLTSRIEEFDEKERLVSGYLEAQRPLLDRATEEKIEAIIQNARTAGFGRELNEAAARLRSAPEDAHARISRGRELMEEAAENLQEAEKTIDDYRAADEALEGRLREAAQEIASAEAAEKSALKAGAAVQPVDDLREAHEQMAGEVTSRTTHRDEFDSLRALEAVEGIIERAKERRMALEDEVNSKACLKEAWQTARTTLKRAHGVLEEYRKSYAAAEEQWGPAALESAPAPESLSSELDDAENLTEQAGRLETAGRFAEAHSRLKQAESTAKAVSGAPTELRAAVVAADRKKREGEEKLRELEARLERAKANEHMMSSLQREQLREYEYQLRNARSGFFGGDWLAALLLFEAIDHHYTFTDGASFMGDDWGGGDWDGADWGGGGDFGGGSW